MFAEIILNTNAKQLNRSFDYIVPKNMEDRIQVGNRVVIPFGNTKRTKEGYVKALKEYSEFDCKEIIEIAKNGLTRENMELASFMSQRYFCNIFDAIKLMLPPGTSSEIEENKTKEKTGRFVYLKQEIEDIEADIEEGIIKSAKQLRVLEFLKENDGVYSGDLQNYTDTTSAVIATLEKKGYIEIYEEQIKRNPFEHKNVKRDTKLELTKEQSLAFEKVKATITNRQFEQFLLYGVTGSRKN